jgi:tripartite-type tricarboxylate transporter receptor subunit TctC
MPRYCSRILLLAFLVSIGAFPASAETWPSRSIKLMVPYTPGGSTDVTARLVSEQLRILLGQPIVIENRGGAGANIGAAAAAKSEPDGYNFLMATSTHATNVSLYKNLSYDFVRDFIPVSQTAFIPNVLVVTKEVPAANLAEFVAYVKGGAHKLSYGSSGYGSASHLSGALFNSMVQGNILHVPYKGGNLAVQDLIAGQIQVYFGPLVEVLEFIRSNHVKALGITTRKRSPLFPEVPTINEYLPGYEVALWNGIVAPTQTSPDVVNKLSQAIATVINQPAVKNKLLEQGSEPTSKTPEEFKRFIAEEVAKWRELVKLSGARVETE